MISRIVVEGFKSIRDEVDIELAPLTILAGANSSGKSSLIQPLLLMKQTFETSYDPGPLRIAGPNVTFSEIDQMLWSAPGQESCIQFRVGIHVRRRSREIGVDIAFRKEEDGDLPLEIARCTWTLDDREYALLPHMTDEELKGSVPEDVLERLVEVSEGDEKLEATRATVRIGSVVIVAMRVAGLDRVTTFPPLWASVVGAMRGLIHVAALRGNPRRTYAVTAVGTEFPGLFHEYVASVVASWEAKDPGKLKRLGADLRQVGLTWKVDPRRKSDAEVEIKVGRLPSPRRGGGWDLVSIADAGFGVSQALPVVVALLAARPQQTVYLEQPEIHLHPRAQIAMPNLLMRAVKRGVQVIVETHSELLLLGIQRLVAEGALDAEEVKLHWFERDDEGVTHVQSADLDEQGAFGDWPVDFAETSMDAMRDYLQAAQPPAQRQIEWPTG